jgi:hypothetical protein
MFMRDGTQCYVEHSAVLKLRQLFAQHVPRPPLMLSSPLEVLPVRPQQCAIVNRQHRVEIVECSNDRNSMRSAVETAAPLVPMAVQR